MIAMAILKGWKLKEISFLLLSHIYQLDNIKFRLDLIRKFVDFYSIMKTDTRL